MRVLSGVAALAVFLVLSAFIFVPSDTPEFDQEKVEAEVLDVMQEFIDGFNELDMTKAVSTFHSDHGALSYGGEILDKAGYLEALEEWREGRVSWQGKWLETSVRVISPEVVVFAGLFNIDVSYPDGTKRHYPQNAWTMLLEKTPDGWKWTTGGHSSSGSRIIEED